jgi:catechol 2,3-dioxygenase-like lactoylglutathione lyase family enzyme
MRIDHLDHLVLTVTNIDAAIDFYTRILGMSVTTFRGDRKALTFGQSKINLHQAGSEFEPKAAKPTPGSADLCFLTGQPLDEVITELDAAGITIEEGPVERTGAAGPLLSVYVRDPDSNLIEVSNVIGNPVS